MEKCEKCGKEKGKIGFCGCGPKEEKKKYRLTPEMLKGRSLGMVFKIKKTPAQEEFERAFVERQREEIYGKQLRVEQKEKICNWRVLSDDGRDDTENFFLELKKNPIDKYGREVNPEFLKRKREILRNEEIQRLEDSSDDSSETESSEESEEEQELIISDGKKLEKEKQEQFLSDILVSRKEDECLREKESLSHLEKEKELDEDIQYKKKGVLGLEVKMVPELEQDPLKYECSGMIMNALEKEKGGQESKILGLAYGENKEEVYERGVLINKNESVSYRVEDVIRDEDSILRYTVRDESLLNKGVGMKSGYEKRFVFQNGGKSLSNTPQRFKMNDPFEESDEVTYGIYANSREYPLEKEMRYGSYYNAILPQVYDYIFDLNSEGQDVTSFLEFGLSFVRPNYNIIQFRIKEGRQKLFSLRIFLVSREGVSFFYKKKELVGVKKLSIEKDVRKRSRKRSLYQHPQAPKQKKRRIGLVVGDGGVSPLPLRVFEELGVRKLSIEKDVRKRSRKRSLYQHPQAPRQKKRRIRLVVGDGGVSPLPLRMSEDIGVRRERENLHLYPGSMVKVIKKFTVGKGLSLSPWDLNFQRKRK